MKTIGLSFLVILAGCVNKSHLDSKTKRKKLRKHLQNCKKQPTFAPLSQKRDSVMN